MLHRLGRVVGLSLALGCMALMLVCAQRQERVLARALEPGLVQTDGGLVRGSRAGNTYAYLGIPFASPPVGDLRWRPPVSPSGWQGELSATAFAPPCPQVKEDGTPAGSEDCLYLNVWTPASAMPESALPVMVFMHGGGNVQGSAELEIGGVRFYDGQLLAERGQVVVVTLQYRLGVLGFLVHPALSAESPQGASGNYGLLDQIAALSWVQRNIASFGGNPSSVLLFGESAGAIDTCLLMASPLAEGLFSRALMESGVCKAATAAERSTQGIGYAIAAGCDGTTDAASCLRSVPTTTLLMLTDTTPISNGLVSQVFGPNVDGYVLPKAPLEVLADGAHNQVPFVIGANADEVMPWVPPMTELMYRAAVRTLFASEGQDVAEQALALYPVGTGPGEYATPREAFTALASDGQFICPARRTARIATMAQAAPVYRYLLTHVLDSPLYESEGSFHGLELWFVFQHLDEVPGYWPKTADRDLETAILSYWTRFAATGNPNGGETTVWPVYESASDPYLDLGSPIAARAGACTAECDFWDGLVEPVFILRQSASPTQAVAGGSLSYTLSLTNGGGDASGLVLRDVLGAGVTFRGASDGGQYQGGSVTWQLGELEAGQRLTRTLQVTVGSVPPGDAITNTVSVACAEGISTENDLALTVSAPSGVMLPLVMACAE